MTEEDNARKDRFRRHLLDVKLSVKRLNVIARQFRVLDEWTITYGTNGESLKAQSALIVKSKVLHVYPYGRKKVPEDYFFHEILHAAISATREVGVPNSIREKREEMLVQDLCQIVRST